MVKTLHVAVIGTGMGRYHMCIRNPELPMIASDEECISVVRMLDAIRRSVESGQEATLI